MNLYGDFKLLDASLKSLSGKDESIRVKATLEVKAHVEAAARELSLERFAKFENELYQEILSLVNGDTLGGKVGGILVIRELIGCTSASAEAKVAKFAKALNIALNASTDFSLIELIADTIGHMAITSPVSDVDYLEAEMNRALSWLREQQKQTTHRKFAACVVLQQLAKTAPTIFFARINDFFDLIWGPLWDQKENIRLAGGKALSACLSVLRERTYHLQWYCYLYDQFQDGFHRGSEEHVHGSLLVVAEALKYTGDFMIPRFKEVCKAIMALKDHKSRIVRVSIITLLPSLAELCPDAFARAHMDETVEFLLRSAKSTDLRPQALLAMGKLCLAVGPYLVPRIDELVALVRDSFPNNAVSANAGRKARQNEAEATGPEALLCLSDMVQGLGAPFHDRVLTLLEPMLQSGLTPELIDTLSIISAHMPNQRNMVQVRLLEETIKVLGGNSRPLLQEPDYLYSWAKVGERSCFSPGAVGTGAVISNANAAYAQQLAWQRHSPGIRSSASLASMPGAATGGFGYSNVGSAHSTANLLAAAAAGGGNGAGLSMSASHSSRLNLGMSMRQGTLSPNPGSTGGGGSSKGGANSAQGTPPKQATGFLGVMQRLGVAGGGRSSSQRSNSLGNAAGAGLGEGGGGSAAGGLSHTTAIGATVIGTGTGLGNENDRRRLQTTPAHELVLLSLRTLASLSVPSGRLILLVKNSVLPYLFSDDYRVRKEAATTCARMLVASIHRNSTKGPSAAAIEDILSRLLEVVVSDTSPQVRLQVLQSFSPDFDRYLARPQHVNTLLLLLADEVFDIKVAATCILGRLAQCNPAAVLPPVRQQLIHLISEMQNCPDYRTIEEAAMMLCNFLRLAKFHVLVRPFMVTLISTLPLQSDFRATTAALEALGELSIVLQNDILPYMDRLLPIIITHMLDSSSYRKQEVAVKTLGQVVSSTGLVVGPYLHYPQLLPSALDLLYRNSASRPLSLRTEVLRTLGLLGALEPNRYAAITTYLQGRDKDRSKREELKAFGAGDGHDAQAVRSRGSTERLDEASSVRDGPGMGDKERDRADSTLSGTGAGTATLTGTNAAALAVVGGAGSGRGVGGQGGELRLESSQTQELIHTEVLAEDHADEPAHMGMYEQAVPRSLESNEQQGREAEENRPTPNAEDYYPRVAVAALIKVLRDPNLTVHHSTATHTIIQIFRGLGVQCLPFLETIVPYFLQIVRKSGPGLRESILLQLSQLVAITRQHIAPYLPSIIDILKAYWTEHLEYVLSIVQQIALTSADTFEAFLPKILPLLLSSLAVPRGVTFAQIKDNKNTLKAVEQTLLCHVSLRMSLRLHIHLFVPVLCKLLTQLQELGPETVKLQAQAIGTLRCLIAVSTGTVVEQCHVIVSAIVHALCRTVQLSAQLSIASNNEVYGECIATLAVLAQQIGHRILPFDSLILRSIDRKGLDIAPYREVSVAIKTGNWSEMDVTDREDVFLAMAGGGEGSPGRQSLFRISEADETKLIGMHSNSGSAGGPSFLSGALDPSQLGQLGQPDSPGGYPEPSKLFLNQQNLARAWDVSQRSTATDWHEWLWKFNIDLLRESPIPTMRACAPLAQAYEPMATELFHAAFVSCWHELSDQYQENLVRSLQKAFRSTTIPSEILQALLNLAEFMEHDVEALPISLSILAELAQKGHAYAKALHYRELEFQTNPAGCFESLININKKLDQYDAASGLLKVVEQIQKKFPALKEVYAVQESWLAKLGHWDEALVKYDAKLAVNPRDSKMLAGKMKCLDALGRWEEAIKICEDNFDLMRVESAQADMKTLTKAAVVGARAAWSLNQWDRMELFCTQIPENNIDGCFMRAVLAVHNEQYEKSRVYIEQTRGQLDTMMTSLLAESYSRAYVPFIMVQQCAELEEIIDYKLLLNRAIAECAAESGATGAEGAQPSTAAGALAGAGSALGNTATSATAAASVLGGGRIFTGMTLENPARSPVNTLTSDAGARLSPSNMAGANRAISPLGTGGASGSNATNASPVVAAQSCPEVVQRKAFLTEKWRTRIRGCCSSGRAAIPFWKYLLNGRRMVLSETEDLDTWLDFVSLCRNGGNKELAERVLLMSDVAASQSHLHGYQSHFRSINGRPPVTDGGAAGPESINSSSIIRTSGLVSASSPVPTAGGNTEASIIMDRRIRFAMLKQQWAVGDRMSALMGLESLIRQTTQQSSTGSGATTDVSYLTCLLKLGEWKISILDPGRPVDKTTRKEVLALYGRATTVDPNCYEAWHQWGLSNYRAIEEARALAAPTPSHALSSIRAGRTPVTGRLPGAMQGDSLSIVPLVVNSIKGLMRALTLGTKRCSSQVTQDMLCILSLWFRYGKIPDVNAVLESGLATVHLNTWLGVLPQLIARIDHPDPATCALLHNLLIRLGTKHSQAIVYPLFVAIKSPRGRRKEAAEVLMNSLRQHSAKLITQALLVSQELVRVAILWEENWHLILEEAAKLFFGDGNIQGMLDLLVPLHSEILAGVNTLRESAFMQAHGHDLDDAWNCINKYLAAMEEQKMPIPTFGSGKKNTANQRPEDLFLFQAWDYYFAVFKRINAQLPQLTALELQTCSPQLFNAHDLDLGVPGTYTVAGHAVRIKSFGSVVGIIRSKQRPRKLRIVGEDGQTFNFLLKGHEDLRQDERAMQLFGLVNALLLNNDRTVSANQADYSIQRYAVMPLSPTAGLISWVPSCDTLHDLIRSYRESRKIMLDVENKLILQVAPNKMYDALPVMHKLEVFEYALTYTAGEDLSKILWLKSENSESWLQRRATYTRSLAVMSMVGYVLGLGDRHPSNLMLDRKTGKVLHIDFGDCFEVAMQREKFPEKVPFRLTRMLVNAMEVAGIEGNYRSTCEKVMEILRENRDSLVATLEAFVHDPLISWRLLNTKKPKVAATPPPPPDLAPTLSPAPVPHKTMPAPGGGPEAGEGQSGAFVGAGAIDAQPGTAAATGQAPTQDISAAASSAALPARPRVRTSSKGTLEPIQERRRGSNNAAHLEAAAAQAMGPITSVAEGDEEDSDEEEPTATPQKPPTATGTSPLPGGGDVVAKSAVRPSTSVAEVQSALSTMDFSKASHTEDKAAPTTEPAHGTATNTAAGAEVGVPSAFRNAASSVKSVSFADTHLTLNSDNTIRTTSARVEIVPNGHQPPTVTADPHRPSAALGMPLSHVTDIEVVDQYDAAARNINSRTAAAATTGTGATEGIAVPGLAQSAGSAFAVPASSLRPNLHVEMANLANSITMQHSPGSGDEGNSSFAHSLSQSRMSVRGSYSSAAQGASKVEALVASVADAIAAQEGGGASAADGDLDLQQELIEKAVVVIRRVMDKLTGLDFPDSSGQAHALEVPDQVDRLIREATSNENLSQSFFGWCPFW